MANEKLFGRVWRVTVGPAGGKGTSWDDLNVSFKVEKTGASSPNSLDLRIHNLSEKSRELFKKGHAVRLEAGYDKTMKLLFTGAIVRAHSRHEGTDWVTLVESGDGVREYKSVVLSESFGPKTSVASVIKSAAEKMGLTIGELKGLGDEKFNQGRQLSGPASAELDSLCRKLGLRWSIQDGTLQIVPTGQALSAPAVLLDTSSGMIGSPEKLEAGWRVRSLLQGGINPGRVIDLRARGVKGLFVAENVTHSGDSHGPDWFTDIEMLPL